MQNFSAEKFFESPDQDNAWLNAQEAARYLRLSENALRIQIFRGRIPVHRFGRRLRFRLSELDSVFVPFHPL